ncbi:MAG TPA: DUF2867 domain-containing protein [Solirubrobacteraceae bacterium]|jgi:hypothetical protein
MAARPSAGTRLSKSEHRAQPWRIHELTRDFRIEDVWALPAQGGAEDFPALVSLVAAGDPERTSSLPARALWSIRWKLGALFGWDEQDSGIGARVASLRERLPADLRDTPCGPSPERLPFAPLYLLDREWAAEIANRTMHGVMHLGWVADGEGRYRGQMTVLVRPNGLLGELYMTAIRPFRHLIVYPAMMRMLERRWAGREQAVSSRSA